MIGLRYEKLKFLKIFFAGFDDNIDILINKIITEVKEICLP